MIKKLSRKEIVEFTDDIVCDACGNSMKVSLHDDKNQEVDVIFPGLVNQQVHGGYDSPALDDGITYAFDVCEKCLKKWFKKFKKQPRETRYL